MSMEDILHALVDSRQQGSSPQGNDPMANLVGSLLTGGQPQGMPQMSGSQQPGVGDIMNLLENVIGGQGGQAMGTTTDPVMMLMQPFVTQLANKMKISPTIALVVVSFVVHKLLAHHPQSGRDSTEFNFDQMLQQMSNGNVDMSMLRSSGMVSELSQKTGMDQAATEQALQAAFALVGKSASGLANRSSKPSAVGSKPKSMGTEMGKGPAKKGRQ